MQTLYSSSCGKWIPVYNLQKEALGTSCYTDAYTKSLPVGGGEPTQIYTLTLPGHNEVNIIALLQTCYISKKTVYSGTHIISIQSCESLVTQTFVFFILLLELKIFFIWYVLNKSLYFRAT